MKLTKEARKNAKHVFKASLVNHRVDADRVRTITGQLIAEKPRHYQSILKEFQRLIRLELSKHHALVESAADLSSEVVDKITRDLKARSGEDLTTEFRTNPKLLGGLRIQIGSDVFDGTVSGRLQLLEKHLTT